MKSLLLNALITQGNSKKRNPEGEDFKISTVQTLVQGENRSWSNINGSGSTKIYGLVTTDIELHPDAFEQFKDLKYPDWYELETETDFRRSGAVVVVTGVKPNALKSAA